MEKRVFLAIFLSFVVLAVYNAFFAPPPPPDAAKPAAVSTPAGVAPSASATPGAPTPTTAEKPAVPVAAPLVSDAAARDIVVETDAVRAVFSTAGAVLKSFQLKKYFEDGKALDLIPADLPDTFPRAFTLSTDNVTLSTTLAAALFRPSSDGLTLGSTPGQIRFEYRDESGLNATKTFYFQPEGKPYVVKVEAAVDVGGQSRVAALDSGPGIGLGYQPDGSRTVPARAIQLRGDKVERLAASALEKQSRYPLQDDVKFAGSDSQYFLSVALPGSEKMTIDYTPITLPVPNDPKARSRTFVAYRVSSPGSIALSYFLGPKQFDILKAVDSRRQLVRAIDFGMFSWLVVQLLLALTWINGFLGNFGWSIVALTLIINLLIFPLRHRSMVSMRKMSALQPEMKAIQDRYAKYKVTDPERQKMNQEVMALYKQKGVNPASGCVPMLLTMPILFAFYALLAAAIELRGAPFMGWITDLSRHDPYYITPVLMGLSMFWQQRMTPTTADPIQQKMFLLMPVIFTVSFLAAPAGLVIYWFTSNLLAIGQQYFTNRLIGAPMPVRRPAPARLPKSPGNAGAGKS